MSWRERYAQKLCSAAEAIGHIAPGQSIFIGSGAAEPAGLVEALTVHGAHLCDNEVVHILTLGPAPYVAPEMAGRFRHTAFFIGPNVREAVQSGRADFLPVFLSELPGLIRSRRVGIDVALLQVSPPDERGYCSLGVSVDVVLAAVESARLVIAQVNPNMPRTMGASLIPVSSLDLLVDLPADLFELAAEPIDEVAAAIGANVASLVPDGATLQTGIGRIPSAILQALHCRHDLGVHTEMLSDAVMALAKSGVITGSKKTLRPGRMVTSFVMGSRSLYDWVDQNPQVELHPSDFTNDPFIIAKNVRMIAINSALSVDLTGQVAADTVGGKFFSGIGGQVDFVRGASRSAGGCRGQAHHRPTVDGGRRQQEPYRQRARRGRRRRYQPGRRTLRGQRVRRCPTVGEECSCASRRVDRNCTSGCPSGSAERGEAPALRTARPAASQPFAARAGLCRAAAFW
jgi:acyl-CoA hydrolase